METEAPKKKGRGPAKKLGPIKKFSDLGKSDPICRECAEKIRNRSYAELTMREKKDFCALCGKKGEVCAASEAVK